MNDPLIPLSLVVPAVGAAVVFGLGPRRGEAVRTVALATVLTTLALVVAACFAFAQGPQTAETARTFEPRLTFKHDLLSFGPGDKPDVSPPAVQFFVGLDGLSVWLFALTAVLMLPAVLVSWKAVTERVNEFYAWLLVLQVAMQGVFVAFDLVLFYVFFELTLVPLFFLIGVWGGANRRHAAMKFFLFTLVGSVITLLGVLGVVVVCYHQTGVLTFSIPQLVATVQERLRDAVGSEREAWRLAQLGVFFALAAGFAVKVPLVPLHTWLPLAHVEAPTAGSVLLAGVLLKIGTYGFLRLCVPLAPDVAVAWGAPLVGWLAAIGVIYGAFCALSQNDVKKLVAYSSVSHLGVCMLGVFALNETGLAGGLIQMVNHGLSTGGLFLLVGMLYERYHTRDMAEYGGMAAKLKLLAVGMVFVCLSSAGLPGLNGFWGEVLSLMGVAKSGLPRPLAATLTVMGATGVVLGAWYLWTMLRRVFFGPLKEPHHEGHEPVRDLDGRELLALAPIVGLCLLLGVWPQPFFDVASRDLKVVATIAADARKRVEARGVGLEERAAIAPAEGER